MTDDENDDDGQPRAQIKTPTVQPIAKKLPDPLMSQWIVGQMNALNLILDEIKKVEKIESKMKDSSLPKIPQDPIQTITLRNRAWFEQHEGAMGKLMPNLRYIKKNLQDKGSFKLQAEHLYDAMLRLRTAVHKSEMSEALNKVLSTMGVNTLKRIYIADSKEKVLEALRSVESRSVTQSSGSAHDGDAVGHADEEDKFSLFLQAVQSHLLDLHPLKHYQSPNVREYETLAEFPENDKLGVETQACITGISEMLKKPQADDVPENGKAYASLEESELESTLKTLNNALKTFGKPQVKSQRTIER